jgi:WD40 repeat protein
LVHGTSIGRIAFRPDGQQLATSGWDGRTKIWDISPAGSRELFTIAAHDGAVNNIVYSPDGTQIATVGDDGLVNLWEAISGELLFSFPRQSGWLNFSCV